MKTRWTSLRLTSLALALTVCLLIAAGCGPGSASYKNPTKAPGVPISRDKQLTMDDLLTYRGIQKHGKAPVALFIAPGEGHVYLRVSHQQRKMVEEQKWFDKYLFQPGK